MPAARIAAPSGSADCQAPTAGRRPPTAIAVDRQAHVVDRFAQDLRHLIVADRAALDQHQRRQQLRAEAIVHVLHDATALGGDRLQPLALTQPLEVALSATARASLTRDSSSARAVSASRSTRTKRSTSAWPRQQQQRPAQCKASTVVPSNWPRVSR